jgi:uncharacterized protein (TIGR00369 family)
MTAIPASDPPQCSATHAESRAGERETAADSVDGPSMAGHWRRLERMYREAPVNAYFEPTIEVADGAALLRMPVKSSSFHAAGALHGSVLFKALDDAAIFAVYSVEPEMFVVTTSFTTTLLKPVSAGVIEATGSVVTRSGRVRVAHSTVTCAGEVVAHGVGAFTTTKIAFRSLASYGGA